MNSYIEINPGTYPPKPTADTAIEEVFHGYNGPLVGLVRQQGKTYLFNCLAGALAGSSEPRVFAYVEVESDRSWPVYEDAMELTAAILLEFAGQRVVVTLSDDLHGVMDVVEIAEGLSLRQHITRSFVSKYPQLARELDYLPL